MGVPLPSFHHWEGAVLQWTVLRWGDLSPLGSVVGSLCLSWIFGRACGLPGGLLGFVLLTLEEKGDFPSGVIFTQLRRGG